MKNLKKSATVFLYTVIAVVLCFGMVGCKKKKSFDELNAEHKAKRTAILKKLSKSYCYDITQMALGQKFSRIDTIYISKYETNVNYSGNWTEVKYESAYIRTDGKVKGKIRNQEGIFTYWFETHIDIDMIDAKIFKEGSMFAKDDNGCYVIYNDGSNDYTNAQLDETNQDILKNQQKAKKMEIKIDGITVRFISKDDSGDYTTLNYYSDRKLTDAQIKKVGKKINMKYGYVMFSSKDDSEYAYYLQDEGIIKHRNRNSKLYR